MARMARMSEDLVHYNGVRGIQVVVPLGFGLHLAALCLALVCLALYPASVSLHSLRIHRCLIDEAIPVTNKTTISHVACVSKKTRLSA